MLRYVPDLFLSKQGSSAAETRMRDESQPEDFYHNSVLQLLHSP